MSEPDIATLARRLAEQNNVDWRALSGSGPDGRIVERDVLDYLARVMAGEEALDPTPEPLPDGMEAWPDQDAPSYFNPAGSAQGARADALADLAEGNAEGLPTDAPATPGFMATEGDELLDRADALGAHVEAPYAADDGQEAAVFSDAAPSTSLTGEVEISDDIFLFDDDDDDDDFYREPFQDDAPAVASDHDVADAWGAASHDPTPDGMGAPPVQPADHLDDPDDALLVADDGVEESLLGSGVSAADAGHAEPDSHEEEPGFEEEQHLEQHVEEVAASIESYDHEFTTPSEQFGEDADLAGWDGHDLSDLGADAGDEAGKTDEGATDLPDLWASDAREDLSEVGAGSDDELAADLAEAFHEPDAPAAEPTFLGAELATAEETAEVTTGETVDDHAEALDAEADDVEDLEVAAALDEADSLNDLQQLDGQPDTALAAALGDLPLARIGNVVRRHVDLSALAGAQLAVGLELAHDEPISAAPFLVRAVAKAVAEHGAIGGQVALAELDGGLRYRRVDGAWERPFAALVEELSGPGTEEDELGLVAVDLSGLDVDEVLLDVDVPAVTLGRVLYDTQRGAHRSTLVLSGDVPLQEGAQLLARVADLLEAPVRLLL